MVASPESDPGHRALRDATIAVVAGRPPRAPQAPLNPPVVLSSTYVGIGPPSPGDRVYTRLGTETWDAFEEALARLERALNPALVFASGMAAISATLGLVPPGGTVVVPRHAYHATLVAAREQAARIGGTVREVDIADTPAVIAALRGPRASGNADDGALTRPREPAAMLWVESPTNPLLEVADIPALVGAAKAAGAVVVVDNTFATPLGQRPLALGADVVVHSVSKYLAGHSDVVLGAALTDSAALRERLAAARTTGGAVAGPWEVWLALRGMRTLALRMERAQASAMTLAGRLAAHPAVAEVGYPGLPDHPQHARAVAQMAGFGAVVTLRPTGGRAAADALVSAVRLWVPATSLGGVESMLERRRRLPSEARTVPDDLLRLSVGIEDVEDLWADLAAALDAIPLGRGQA